MSVMHDQLRYHTFLLTLWEERNREPTAVRVWRFRLEDPQSGQRYLFVDEHSLIEHLSQWRSGQESYDANAEG